MLPFCLSWYPKQHQCENGNLEHKYHITCLAILDARDSLCPLLESSPQVHQIETGGVDVSMSGNHTQNRIKSRFLGGDFIVFGVNAVKSLHRDPWA